MKKLKVWINKRFVDIDKAKISILDRGFLYGDGIFETMRSYAGIVFKLDEHLNRLFESLKVMKMKAPYAKRYFKAMIYKGLKINKLKSAYIRITITRGAGRFGIDYKDTFIPNVVIVTKEFGEYPDWMYARGISAKVVEIRQNEYSPISKIKSLNFLNCILARLSARAEGFDEAILANTRGRIAEAATSNIFLVRGNTVITPSLDSGILSGVTRGVVLEIAGRLGVDIEEKKVSQDELLNADEVFLTNSLVEVLPVTRIDSKNIGSGKVGDMTKLIHKTYERHVIKEVLGS